MKKVYLAVVLIFLFLSSVGFSAEKIGFVDSEEIINNYKGIILLREQYNKLSVEWEKEAGDRKQEIDKLKNQLAEQMLMLSNEEKKKREIEIEEKQKEYENFISNIWGEGGESEKKYEELVKPVIEEISNVLQKIGSDEGYVMIFDISKGNIMFAKTNLDLTDRVLYEINKEFTVAAVETKETKFYVFELKDIGTEATSKSLGRQISNLLKSGLDKFEAFETIESQTVSETMRLLGFMKEKDLDDGQIRRVAIRLQARIIVFGEVEIVSGKIKLKLKWMDFNKGQDIKTKEFSIDEKEKLETVAQDVMTFLGREVKGK